MMKKILYMMFAALSLLFFSHCEKVETADPDFDVVAERATYRAGEEISFNFTGNADFLVFYSGETGNDYRHRSGNDPGIPVKSMADNMPENFTYTYTVPGNYSAVFVGKRADFTGANESVKEVAITITDQ
jgi:hypothetical protein